MNGINESGRTALHLAAINADLALIEALLGAGRQSDRILNKFYQTKSLNPVTLD